MQGQVSLLEPQHTYPHTAHPTPLRKGQQNCLVGLFPFNCGLNLCPWKRHVEVPTPKPQNVALCGNRVRADVIS